MNSRVVKRSVIIAGHKTSVNLEDAFWEALNEIASSRQVTPSELLTLIDAGREHSNLSSCLRLFALDFYVDRGRKVCMPSAPPDVVVPELKAGGSEAH